MKNIDKNNPDFENETFRAYFPDKDEIDADTRIPIKFKDVDYTLLNFTIIRDIKDKKEIVFAYKIKDNEDIGKFVLYYIPRPAHKKSEIYFKVFKEVCPIDDYMDVWETFKSTQNEIPSLQARSLMKGRTTGSGKMKGDTNE